MVLLIYLGILYSDTYTRVKMSDETGEYDKLQFIIDYINNGQILIDVIWFLAGMLAPVCFAKIKHKVIRYKLTRKLKKENIPLAPKQVYSLDHGAPYYDIKNIRMKDSQKSFWLKIPEEQYSQISLINPHFANVSSDMYFEPNESMLKGFKTVFEVISSVGITQDDFITIFEESKVKVAKDFLQKIRCGEVIFNGEMFGVYRVFLPRIQEEDEAPEVTFEYMKTNFYTHRVMAEVFHAITEKTSEILKVISDIEVINKMYPFMTGLGVDALVLLDNTSFVLAKRTGKLCNMEKQDKWHMSMNEAVSFTDIDYEKEVSLIQCVERGLKEELGIDCKKLGPARYSFYFGDIFLVKNLFEIGITVLVKVDMQFSEIENCYQIARDVEIETKGLKEVPLKKLGSFMKRNELTDACRYTLAMWYNRKGIFRDLQ